MTSSSEKTATSDNHAAACDALMQSSGRLADLAKSFPLLFHMLAVGTDRNDRRERVLAMIESGRPLSEVARVATMPMCLRRIEAGRGDHGKDIRLDVEHVSERGSIPPMAR